MKRLLLGIYDKLAEELGSNIILAANRVSATRAFSDFIKSGNNFVADSPKDYCLVELGTLDMETGSVEGIGVATSASYGKNFFVVVEAELVVRRLSGELHDADAEQVTNA